MTRILLVAVVAFFAVSCSKDDKSSVEPPAGWIRMYGVTTEDGSGQVLADYEICLVVPKADPLRCVKSAADGSYTLWVPPNTRIANSFRKEDYFPEIGMSVTETSDLLVNFGGLPASRAPILAAFVGATIDPTKGQLVFSVFGPNAFVPDGGAPGSPGVTIALSPRSGLGPYYTDSGGIPDKMRTTTSTSGLGAILNVDPGSITATFTPPTGVACQMFAGWPSDTPGGVGFYLEPGTITHISAACR